MSTPEEKAEHFKDDPARTPTEAENAARQFVAEIEEITERYGLHAIYVQAAIFNGAENVRQTGMIMGCVECAALIAGNGLASLPASVRHIPPMAFNEACVKEAELASRRKQ